jgi:hypothetical protein
MRKTFLRFWQPVESGSLVESGLSGDAKEFKVRFYGLTYDESKPEASYHNWKCRKNGDSDPTITCEIETPEVH